MSTPHEQVAGLLARLDKTLNKNKGKNKKDWKAINEARNKIMFKPKEGKNEIMFLTPAFGQDPFTEWGFHNNLQETSYYSVPCDLFNSNTPCIVCETVEELKKDWDTNKLLWSPIEQKLEYYAPLINLETAATIAEGPKWMRVSKTIMNQLVEWLKNLEEDELPFYDAVKPSRVLINYDKKELPQSQYKLERKDLKHKFSEDQIAEWAGAVIPISEYILPKSQDEIKKIVDDYFKRVYDAVADSQNGDTVTAPAPDAVTSKLSKLK